MEENKTTGSNPDIKNWIQRHPLFTCIVIILVLFMIGSFFNSPNQTQTDSTSEQSNAQAVAPTDITNKVQIVCNFGNKKTINGQDSGITFTTDDFDANNNFVSFQKNAQIRSVCGISDEVVQKFEKQNSAGGDLPQLFNVNMGQSNKTNAVTSDNTKITNASQPIQVVPVKSTTPPVITLNGSPTVNLGVGDVYIDQGATATDTADPSVQVVVGGDTVDTSTMGTYHVTYNATDSFGNNATQVIRTVIIANSDQSYAQSMSANVLPFLQAGNSNVQLGASDAGSYDFTDALSSFQQAQANFSEAQSGLQPIQASVPTNLVNVNTEISQCTADYLKGVNLMVTALTDSIANGNNSSSTDVSEMKSAASYISQAVTLVTQASANLQQIAAQNGSN